MKTIILLSILVLLACSACAQDQPVYSGNIYSNSTIGFTIHKPDSWLFVSERQSLENRNNIQLQDEELEREVQSHANLPTVSISKYPEPHPTVNPTVQVKHLEKPSADLLPQDVLEATVQQIQNVYADFRVTKPIQVARLGAHKAATMQVAFTMETVDGGAFSVHSIMWVVERRNDLFIIGMSGPSEGDDASEEEFMDILSSIIIEK
jgi:hypothetical protein